MDAKQVWYERLNSISIIRNAGILEWQPILSGTSNHMFKVKTQAGVWMVRINRAALGIDRHQEQQMMGLIEPLGIGPKVIENDPVSGHLITEFIDQPTWQRSDFQDPLLRLKLAASLQQIHQLEYRHLPSRLDQRLKRYLKAIKNVSQETSQQLLADIQHLDTLGFWQACNRLYHSDLNPQNLIGHQQLIIIDWEYAGQGHPFLDWLILEHETQLDWSDHYPLDINPLWISSAQSMIQGMMKLWPKKSP